MKRLYILIISIITIVGFEVLASDMREISDIYIESQGNNKYEAKVKAHELGMRRVLFIIADKMGIPSTEIRKVPYLRLKEVLNISFVSNEKETETSYSAVVNYKYDLYSMNKLLLDYGSDEVDNKFYEYLVLPIFKQKNVINIWDETRQWNKKWVLSRALLEQNKLIYPEQTKELMRILSNDKVFKLSYRNFIEIFQPRLFKKIILVVCEFFTDTNTGASVMKLDFITLGPNDKRVVPFEYRINSIEEIAHIMDRIIDKTVNDYGKLVGNRVVEELDKKESIVADKEESSSARTIMLNSYIYDDEGSDNIRRKLKNIKTIENITIKHDYDKKYKIIITTKSNDFELAEGFYLNGLSFKKYGNIYNLIDVIEGN